MASADGLSYANVCEDDVGMLTLSSLHWKGRNGGETAREDDVGVLTLSSSTKKGQNSDKIVREDKPD